MLGALLSAQEAQSRKDTCSCNKAVQVLRAEVLLVGAFQFVLGTPLVVGVRLQLYWFCRAIPTSTGSTDCM